MNNTEVIDPSVVYDLTKKTDNYKIVTHFVNLEENDYKKRILLENADDIKKINIGYPYLIFDIKSGRHDNLLYYVYLGIVEKVQYVEWQDKFTFTFSKMVQAKWYMDNMVPDLNKIYLSDLVLHDRNILIDVSTRPVDVDFENFNNDEEIYDDEEIDNDQANNNHEATSNNEVNDDLYRTPRIYELKPQFANIKRSKEFIENIGLREEFERIKDIPYDTYIEGYEGEEPIPYFVGENYRRFKKEVMKTGKYRDLKKERTEKRIKEKHMSKDDLALLSAKNNKSRKTHRTNKTKSKPRYHTRGGRKTRKQQSRK